MDDVLQGSRWNVFKEISERENTASAIAERTGTSMPSVSQHLKLLEAYDLIERSGLERGSVGKPRQRYRLKKPICKIAFARRGFASSRSFTPQGFQLTLMQLLFLPREEQLCLLRLLCTHNDLLSCAVAFLRRSDTKIEILLVTDDIKRIREAYSAIRIDCDGKAYDIAAWTHSAQEITKGIEKNDAHFKELMRLATTIHDPQNILSQVNP